METQKNYLHTIYAALAVVLTFVLPLVVSRILDDASNWVWDVIYAFALILALSILLYTEYIRDILFHYKEQKLKAFGIIFVSLLILLLGLYWIFIGKKENVELDYRISFNDHSHQTPEVSGIAWKPVYGELDFYINNNSDYEINRLNLVVTPDQPIAAIGQVSKLEGVTFNPYLEIAINSSSFAPGDKRGEALPWELLATNEGYEIKCNLIQPGEVLRIKIATANLKPQSKPKNGPLIHQDAILVTPIDNTLLDHLATVWWGFPGVSNEVYQDPKIVEEVRVKGSFVVNKNEHTVDKRIKANNIFAKIQKSIDR